MLELLAPAGSMEALTAAVQNGADAVYLGYGDFNARRNAKNFTWEEAAQAAPPGGDSIPDAKTAGSGIQEELAVKDAEREVTGDLEDIPTVRPEVGQDTMELPDRKSVV